MENQVTAGLTAHLVTLDPNRLPDTAVVHARPCLLDARGHLPVAAARRM